MNVQQVAIDKIRPYENNPRNNDGAVEAVANSIREFGFQQPIVVDMDGVIIAGHTRYKAAQALGLTEVPVVYADLSPEKAQAYVAMKVLYEIIILPLNRYVTGKVLKYEQNI